MKAEFQRIARRDKKAFLSEKCEKIRGTQQNGRDQRSLQENQRDQGNISCKEGHKKEQKWGGPNKNSRYEEEVARIHRRTIQKRTNGQDNHDGVVTHLESGILECEVKWALGRITINKASGGDGIQAELFKILKDNAMKVLHSICQQIWKTQQQAQNWKMSFFIPVPKKGNDK